MKGAGLNSEESLQFYPFCFLFESGKFFLIQFKVVWMEFYFLKGIHWVEYPKVFDEGAEVASQILLPVLVQDLYDLFPLFGFN